MATLTPGVLLKLLQSMNSDSKPFGEHRSAVLQVTGIVPAPSDDLWPSHGFYIQVSDSLHSTYVSLSEQEADLIVSNRPQLGQLVHLDRLKFDLPVPRALGLRPISFPRHHHSFIGSPEPLIVLSTPSHVQGFLIQPASPSSAAATVKPRAVFAPKENLLTTSSNISSSGSNSSVSKPKRRFSSPATRNPSPVPEKQGSKVGSRAPSPVPSKCEVPSLVAAREENRKIAREPAIVVPSRYRQPSPVGRKTAVASPMVRKGAASPGGRRLSGGIKFSPVAGEGGGKKKAGLIVAGISRVSDGRLLRKSWDDNSSSSENSSAESKSKSGWKSKVHEHAPMKAQVATASQASDAGKDKSHNEEESTEEKRRKSCKVVTSVMENPYHMPPKFAVYDRKWTDGSIPLDNVSQNLARLGKEALERRNVASIAAAEALEEALATESIIRSLSMFSELCLTSKTGNLLRTINTFLSIYDDLMKETSTIASLIASHACNLPVDLLSINRAKSASLWVEAALRTDLEVLNLINSTTDSHSKLKSFEKIAIPCGDFPKSHKRNSLGIHAKSQTKASTTCSKVNFWTRGQDIGQTLKLAEALRNEMQYWFLKFVEGAIAVGFFIFGEYRKGDQEASFDDNSRVAAVVFHLKRVSDWIDKVLSKPEDEILVEKIEQVRQKICNFVMNNMGLIKPIPTSWDEAKNDTIMTNIGSTFNSVLSFGKA